MITINKGLAGFVCLLLFLLGAASGGFGELMWLNNHYQELYKSIKTDAKEKELASKRVIDALMAENKLLEKIRASLEDRLNKIDHIVHSKKPVVQGVNREQLRSIIKSVLTFLEITPVNDYTNLLMVTAQIESDLGYSYRQHRGPAVGIFQMEPATEKSVWNDFLKYHKKLREKIEKLRVKDGDSLRCRQSEYNLAYSIAMAAMLYKQRRADPTGLDVRGLMGIYKKSWNTYRGKSTEEKMIRKLSGSKVIVQQS